MPLQCQGWRLVTLASRGATATLLRTSFFFFFNQRTTPAHRILQGARPRGGQKSPVVPKSPRTTERRHKQETQNSGIRATPHQACDTTPDFEGKKAVCSTWDTNTILREAKPKTRKQALSQQAATPSQKQRRTPKDGASGVCAGAKRNKTPPSKEHP